MRAYREELFGPAAVVYKVKDDEEAVALANDSDFGLGATVMSGDVDRARAVAERLEAGMVWINQPTGSSPELPFGGVKRSGYGRELSELAMFEFANRRLVRTVPARKAEQAGQRLRRGRVRATGQTGEVTEVWPAPHAPSPVDAVVALPGSKSITARALVLAALADGPSRLVRPLRARDTDLMAAALRAMGMRIDEDGDDLVVTPAPLRGPAEVDAGLAGTVLRFLPPVAALADGPVRVDGDPRLHERPNAGLIAALRELGVGMDDGGRGRAPFTVHGTGAVRGGAVTVDARESSQIVSGLLLAAARFDEGLDLALAGGLPSMPHVEMTVTTLARARRRGHRPPTAAGGSPRADPGARPHRRARPLQRRALPGRRAGDRRARHRPGLAGAHHAARRPARPAAHRDGRGRRAHRRRPDRHRQPARSPRWSPTWARSAS